MPDLSAPIPEVQAYLDSEPRLVTEAREIVNDIVAADQGTGVLAAEIRAVTIKTIARGLLLVTAIDEGAVEVSGA